MTRLVLLALLILAAALVAWVVVMVLRVRGPALPPPTAPNARWAAYYEALAEQARRDGNTRSAAEYESLAATYRTLPD